MKFTRYFATLLLASIITQTSSIHADDDAGARCAAVLKLAGRDENLDLQKNKITQITHDEYCSDKGVKAGVDLSKASRIIDFLTGSNSVDVNVRYQSVDKFCKEAESYNETELFKVGASSLVVREAISSWERCMALNERVRFSVYPQNVPEGLLIEIQRGKDNFSFLGMKVLSSAKLDCTSSIPLYDKGKKTQRVSESSTLKVNDSKILSISCARKPVIEKPGKQYYPPVSFTVSTDRGSMPIHLPGDRSGPEYQSQWLSEQYQLTQRIQTLSNRKARGWIVCSGGPGWQVQDFGRAACPTGTNTDESKDFVWEGGGHGQGWKCSVCSTIDP
ncbi:hypothetical protein TRE132_21210 [Pseudomonas chlororaphis subsp. aurantiaca]|nr:hypothetical protein TRE132_21210 [Pseudomonas chlororaphis subsp. aurantiaca]